MLKIKYDNEGTMTIDRVSFPAPCYIDGETLKDFRDSVFAVADDALFKSLEPDLSANEGDEEEQEKAFKLRELRASGLRSYACWEREHYAFAIGIDFIPCKAVPEEYSEVHTLAIRYARTYKGVESWSDERKAEFKKLKTAMSECFMKIFRDVLKEGFELKLSSKAVAGYVHTLYHTSNQNKKGSRGTMWKAESIYKGFKFYMQAINVCTGVAHDEKRGKTINVF